MVNASFRRPEQGPTFEADERKDLPFSMAPAWRSNGGGNRGHLARTLPFSLEIAYSGSSPVVALHLIGIFAMYANRGVESAGTLGATIQFEGPRGMELRQELLNGQHYGDAEDDSPVERMVGDGTSLLTLGRCDVEGKSYRVDQLTIDVPPDTGFSTVRFKDLGSPASFVLFDAIWEVEEAQGCPFSARGGGIPLSEIAPIVRVGDRVRFTKALAQLERSVLATEDLDEARGEALTFLALVTAAMLEMGGSRELHREQLEAARELESQETHEEIAVTAKRRAEEVTAPLFREDLGPSTHLVERALALVERNFARNLTDAVVAAQLGLSTSHFRFLFRQATGQPFHKYLVALRLEKARMLLIEQQVPVSNVARLVGFSGLSHFSRAFTQRFGVNPTSLRRGGPN